MEVYITSVEEEGKEAVKERREGDLSPYGGYGEQDGCLEQSEPQLLAPGRFANLL